MSRIALTDEQVEEYLVEVITGSRFFFHEDSIYAVRFPAIEVKDVARLIYFKALKELKSKGVPTKEQMRETIKEMNIIPEENYNIIKNLDRFMESNRKAHELSTDKTYKAELDLEYEKLFRNKCKLERTEEEILINSAEAKAESARLSYYVSQCSYCGDTLETKIWDNFNEFLRCTDLLLVERLKVEYARFSFGLPISIVRAIARHEEWRKRWKSSKESNTPVFMGVSSQWDVNKLNVCYWSEFYDSILKHPKAPNDDIINDDEKLHEWIKRVNEENNTSSEPASDNVNTVSVNQPTKVRRIGVDNNG